MTPLEGIKAKRPLAFIGTISSRKYCEAETEGREGERLIVLKIFGVEAARDLEEMEGGERERAAGCAEGNFWS